MRLDRETCANLPRPEDQGKADVIYFDDDLSGFGLRVRGGKRSWIVQYRAGHRTRRMTIGSAGKISADQARRVAAKLLARVVLGEDPQGEKRQDRDSDRLLVGVLVERYLEVRTALLASGKLRRSTYKADVRYLRKHWKPLHRLPATKVDRADASAGIARIAREHGSTAALRAGVALSGLYQWMMREPGTGVTHNPTLNINKPAEPAARDRVLDDAEIADVWAACRDDDYGRIVRLLMLSGQRRDEIGGMRWSELDLDRGLWSIPTTRTKNKKPHTLPLPQLALEIIKAVPRRVGVDHLFGRAGFRGWAKAKESLDGRVTAVRGRPLAPWRIHDLRRTCATGLGDLGVQPHVIETVLNHVSGSRAGVAGVYNKSVYMPEMITALALWNDKIRALVGGGEAVIVPMPKHA